METCLFVLDPDVDEIVPPNFVEAQTSEPSIIQVLALSYKLKSAELEEDPSSSKSPSLRSDASTAARLCTHNSEAAVSAGMTHLSLIWKLLATFFTPSSSLADLALDDEDGYVGDDDAENSVGEDRDDDDDYEGDF